MVGTTRNYVDLTAGTIDYAKGIVKLNTINVTSVSDIDGVTSSDIRIVVVPDSKDIKAVRNQILNIDLTNTTILPKVDTISIGQPGAASSFSTTTTMPSASQSF